ncbi:Acetyltransferase, GNAT family [Criblamydia sequanensis CRIB-18]|uniref:Acetyltransferase, GNAT family n=2 Tax=Candidatus Criblamydia sequanensis TaxID=340071 RepID=A0A090D1U8_9BACT|nr:Acetyltransferase, GNAT family [Criblamydia sequanensis CRIB-18]
MMSNFTIEKASLKEMDFLLAQARNEGWNPGLSDASAFYSTDPNGFFIGKLDGEKIGCISSVAYDANYGFLGFYIVIPKYRGKGYGLKLWNHAISHQETRSIGLDGVVAQQDNYKKSGFRFFYNNIRYGGKVKGLESKELIPINETFFQAIIDFDEPIFGANRSHFLKAWFQMPNSWGYAKKISGSLTGYGWIRKCHSGFKIGPLYAHDQETAREIFLALADRSHNSEIFLDVPQPNEEAIGLAEESGMRAVFETARMYKGIPPKQELKKVFGVSTFELG